MVQWIEPVNSKKKEQKFFFNNFTKLGINR